MPTHTQHLIQIWNPVTTFSIINPSKGLQTCVGSTVKGQRCKNPILARNRHEIKRMLGEIAQEPPSFSEMESKLDTVASLCLCKRYHRGQVGRIIGKWKSLIDQEEARLSQVSGLGTPIITTTSSVEYANEQSTTSQPDDRSRSRSTTISNEPPTLISLNTTASAQQTDLQHQTLSDNVSYGTVVNEEVTESETLSAERAIDTNEDTPPPSEQPSSLCTITHVARRSKDEECVICTDFCTFSPHLNLVWCKGTCGRNMHRSCFNQWRDFATTDGEQLRCPICRGIWQAECSHDEDFEIWTEEELGLERLFSLMSL